jgi:hypothetical protein
MRGRRASSSHPPRSQAEEPQFFNRLLDDAIKVFQELKSKWFVPLRYGTFRLSFEDMDEPPRWLRELAHVGGLSHHIRMLEEGTPEVF